MKCGKIKRKSSFRQLRLFSVYFIDLCDEEEMTPLSKKRKPEERISTCGSENESDDNEFVKSKKKATRHKSQAIRGTQIKVRVFLTVPYGRHHAKSVISATIQFLHGNYSITIPYSE